MSEPLSGMFAGCKGVALVWGNACTHFPEKSVGVIKDFLELENSLSSNSQDKDVVGENAKGNSCTPVGHDPRPHKYGNKEHGEWTSLGYATCSFMRFAYPCTKLVAENKCLLVILVGLEDFWGKTHSLEYAVE